MVVLRRHGCGTEIVEAAEHELINITIGRQRPRWRRENFFAITNLTRELLDEGRPPSHVQENPHKPSTVGAH